MWIVALLITLALTGVLLWAGLEKLRMRATFARTFAGLGFGGWPGRLLTVAVPAAEVVTAVGLVLLPTSVWPRAAVAVLGVTFAVAGLLALRATQPVSCSCLGAGGGTLGWRQVALLPGWLGAAVALHLLAANWTVSLGVQYLAGVLVALVGLRAIPTTKAARNDIGYRRAIDEGAIVRRAIVVRSQEVGTL